eukprot:4204105-Alexandrium_andersonii.AAC.1
MSASLVGSEMCIRDSSPLAHSDRPASAAARRLAVAAPRHSIQPRTRPPCLLYTSDAADDM